MMRIIKAFGYSCAGLNAVFRTEAAFRQELALCAIGMPTALLIHANPCEHALLIGSLFLVLIIELLNSAIETLVDRISPELHPLSKNAKDIGSASVLVALLNTVAIWTIILVS